MADPECVPVVMSMDADMLGAAIAAYEAKLAATRGVQEEPGPRERDSVELADRYQEVPVVRRSELEMMHARRGEGGASGSPV